MRTRGCDAGCSLVAARPPQTPPRLLLFLFLFPRLDSQLPLHFVLPFFLILNLFISREEHFEKPYLIAFLIFSATKGIRSVETASKASEIA